MDSSLRSWTVDLLARLVQIPSITGQETAIQDFLSERLAALSLQLDRWCPTRDDLASHPAFSDDGLPLGDRPVIVARWQGSHQDARSLILNAHVDVVPVGDERAWSDGGPWSGACRDGFVWGRGSCDMKAGLVAAMAAIHALQSDGAKPRGDVTLQCVIGEESGGAGTLAAVMRGYRADAAIVLEPTRLAICPVGAGAASFRLYIPGKAAHGAMRGEGVSAIEKFYVVAGALARFERARQSNFRHSFYAPDQLVAPLSIGKIVAGDWPSTVPDSLIAEGRYGILPGENIADARARFEQTVFEAAESDDWLRDHPPVVEWFEGQFEPAATPADAPIIAALAKAHHRVLGLDPKVQGVSYGSDLRFFTNNANMHAVLYGPGDVRLAHSVDERVSVDEVIHCAEVLSHLILEW